MEKISRLLRRHVEVPCHRLTKKTPPVFWVGMFLLACFLLPYAATVKIILPGMFEILPMAIEIAKRDLWQGVGFFGFFLAMGIAPMFFANAAFVFLRVAAGYDVRRNGSIRAWVFNKFWPAITGNKKA